jgi:hypothetical protein
MIPYDDLVAALAAWRERQGLPVSTIGGATIAPAPPTAPVARATPPAPPRPPAPPPRAPVPPPLAAPDALEVEDAALLADEHYENEGADFAMSFGGDHEHQAEPTAISGEPQRPSDPFGGRTDPSPAPGGFPGRTNNRNDDW